MTEQKYPALTEMGVANPNEIARYSLQTINNRDILRIIYKRQKGSFLPRSKKFTFGRAQKMVITDGGKQETELVHEISPFVLKVTSELQQLVSSQHTNAEKKAIIADEMQKLEEETHSRIAYIKSLIDDLD